MPPAGRCFSISAWPLPSPEAPGRPSPLSDPSPAALARRSACTVPVVLGSWLSDSVDDSEVGEAVERSLDRKVCNTLNTCCLVRGPGIERHAARVLDSLCRAGESRSRSFKLHVAEGCEDLVPPSLFSTSVEIVRAQGPVVESQAETIARRDLGIEWEWEETPEVSFVAVDSIDEAVALFNDLSPRLVGSLVSNDPEEHERFFNTLDAPFVGDAHTRWVDGQFALNKPELGLSNWQHGRLFGRGGVLTGDDVYTIRLRYRTSGRPSLPT